MDEEKLRQLDWRDRAKLAMAKLPEDEAMDIMRLLLEQILTDVAAGITGERESPAYEAIDKIYRPKGCYFCDRDIDPNETEFNLDRGLCLFCRLKLANALKFVGVDPKIVIPDAGQRRIQISTLRGMRKH